MQHKINKFKILAEKTSNSYMVTNVIYLSMQTIQKTATKRLTQLEYQKNFLEELDFCKRPFTANKHATTATKSVQKVFKYEHEFVQGNRCREEIKKLYACIRHTKQNGHPRVHLLHEICMKSLQENTIYQIISSTKVLQSILAFIYNLK